MKKTLLVSILCLSAASGCSTLFHRNNDEQASASTDQASSARRDSSEETPPASADPGKSAQVEKIAAQNSSLKAGMSQLEAKIDALQSQIAEMNQRLEATRSKVDNLTSNQRPQAAATAPQPTEGALPLPPAGDHASESAFAASDPIQKYRQAMVLFGAQNYADAILAFSKFTDRYPDHALAGSAQYYLGECYFKQGNYKLAAKEFERVITSYDRSPHIADTLRDLAASEDQTGQKDAAERHRPLLNSLFPNSPAAIREDIPVVAKPPVEAQAAPSAPLVKAPNSKPSNPSDLDSPPGDSTPATETAPQ